MDLWVSGLWPDAADCTLLVERFDPRALSARARIPLADHTSSGHLARGPGRRHPAIKSYPAVFEDLHTPRAILLGLPEVLLKLGALQRARCLALALGRVRRSLGSGHLDSTRRCERRCGSVAPTDRSWQRRHNTRVECARGDELPDGLGQLDVHRATQLHRRGTTPERR